MIQLAQKNRNRLRKIALSLAMIFVMLSCFGLAHAQNTTELLPEYDTISLQRNLPYFKDKTNIISFHQARAHFNRHRNYTAPYTPTLDFGHEKNLYWFKLSVRNQSQVSDWVFSLAPSFEKQAPLARQMQVYDVNGDGTPLMNFFGVSHFKFDIAPGQKKDLLVMVETMENAPFIAAPRLMQERAFEQEKLKNTLAYSLIFSAMIVISSIALTLFFMSNLKALLSFAFYTPSAIGSFLLLEGHFSSLTAYLSVDIINLIITISYGLVASLTLALGHSVLDLKNNKKVLDLIVSLLAIITGISGFCIAFIPGLPQAFTEIYLLLPGYAAALITILSVFYALRYQSYLLFALAWAILGVGYLMPVMSQQFSLLIHIIVLTLYMLAYIKLKSIQSHQKHLDLKQDFESKLHSIKVETETEKQALQRKRESEKNMLQDLRQRDAVRAHELKVAKAEADHANKAKSDFLAMISHEIRTPMTGIMGMVQLTLESDLNNQQREYIETIKYSGETLLALLNDILDFSKIESGHMELEHVNFELRRLVQSVTMLMSGRANEQGIDLKIDIANDIEENVQGDPNRIRQILLNLLSNAIKFTKSGSVTIKIEKETSDKELNTFLFSVIDTGIGISESAQEKLFGAYQQADETISRRYGGTGLGLNICKMLVEAMGGKIGVKSKQGSGSTFWFTLPLTVTNPEQATQRGEGEKSDTPSTLQPLKILSVDDNEINLKVLSGLLEKDGHSVTSASSGPEALELLSKDSFDLVLADMQMPQMDGPNLCREIRADKNSKISHLPVIAVTGNTLQKDVKRCRAAGMTGFLSKPPSLEAIRSAVEKAMQEPITMPEPRQKITDLEPEIENRSSASPEENKTAENTKVETKPIVEENENPPISQIKTPAHELSNEEKGESSKPEDKKPLVEPSTVVEKKGTKQTPLSATAEMAESVMTKMTEVKKSIGKGKTDEKETMPTQEMDTPQSLSQEDHTNKPDEQKAVKKTELKDKMSTLKEEGKAFYKKALASVMLGLGKAKTDTLDDIIIDEEEDKITQEDIEEFAEDNLEDYANEFAEEEEETGPSLDEMADEAGKSVDLMNTSMIKDLQESLGKETLDDLFVDLFKKAQEILEALKEAASYTDYDDVSERGHELKGMAANFGLERLAALGGALEKAGMKRNKERMDFLVPLYEPILEETKKALKQWQKHQE